MPLVTVSARQLVMPRLCVCCCGPPDRTVEATATRVTGKRVRRSQEHRFDFPACASCVAHHRAEPEAGNYLLWGMLSLGLLTPLLWLMYASAKSSARAMRGPACEAGLHLATYVRWYGSEQTFRFDSRRFADAFHQFNAAAGKNAWAKLDELPGPFIAPLGLATVGTLAPALPRAAPSHNVGVAGVLATAVVFVVVGLCVVGLLARGTLPPTPPQPATRAVSPPSESAAAPATPTPRLHRAAHHRSHHDADARRDQ